MRLKRLFRSVLATLESRYFLVFDPIFYSVVKVTEMAMAESGVDPITIRTLYEGQNFPCHGHGAHIATELHRSNPVFGKTPGYRVVDQIGRLQ